MKKPNILFVFSDQHRWCDLGCYGNGDVISPNLDSFSQNAVQFTNCISNSPVCVPARGSMLTGLLPLKHKAITNDLPICEDVKSIAHVLNKDGYHTGYIGKWHLAGIPRDGFIPQGKGRLGFSEWKVCNCNHRYQHAYYYDENDQRISIDNYEPIAQTDLAIDFIKRNKDNPWSLVLSWSPPHDPYFEVPDKYLDIYRDKPLKIRDNVPEEILDTKKCTLTKDQIAKNYSGYYAHITALDEQFGRLLETVKMNGLDENTIIIYTSDHGDMLGSQGFTNKQLPYEESIKVPLLVSWKGKTFCGVNDEMIGLVDLPVSILGLAGLKFSNDVDGQDHHKLFTDKNAKGPEACYIFDLIPCHQAYWRGSKEWRGIRTKNHTYARTATDAGFILYDNKEDPLQKKNLINMPKTDKLKAELQLKLDEFIERHDKLQSWEEFIRTFGFIEEWNKSQAYFNEVLLDY